MNIVDIAIGTGTAAWIIGFVVQGLMGMMTYVDSYRDKEKRRGARMILFAWAWPFYLARIAGKSLVEVWKSAELMPAKKREIERTPDESKLCGATIKVIYTDGAQPAGLPSETWAMCDREDDYHKVRGGGLHSGIVHGQKLGWQDKEFWIEIQPAGTTEAGRELRGVKTKRERSDEGYTPIEEFMLDPEGFSPIDEEDN